MKIALINGPNLNTLGRRKPEIYGDQTLEDIVESVSRRANELALEVWAYQSNNEGQLIDAVQQAASTCRGIIINPGAYSHTSIAHRDALEASELPSIEVHLTNVFAREEFRHHSYTGQVARGVIAGLGAFGYVVAVEALARAIDDRNR